MREVTLDIERVRASFPALNDDTAYFDGPGGSQTPRAVAHAVAAAMGAGLANRAVVTAAERRAEDIVQGSRSAVADLLGCAAGGVVFGRSMTQVTYDMARTLAKDWQPGDEVVVTRLDHDANIRPWVQAAESVGATVRWADFDPETAELPAESVTELLGDRTRLVAVTAASNLLGSRPDVAAITAAAHAAGALAYVDGVHLTAHCPVDVAALGADFFACSPYKFFGPHHGVVVADPDLLHTLDPDKLLPATNAVPERFELGTLPYELLAGTTATVDFIAGLAPSDGTRRDQVLASMAAVEAHEDELFTVLLDGLHDIDRVRRYGDPARRTPTVLFAIEGMESQEVYERLAARGVNAPASSFYAIEASRRIGLGDGGAVRVGLAPYTTRAEIDRLLTELTELSGR